MFKFLISFILNLQISPLRPTIQSLNHLFRTHISNRSHYFTSICNLFFPFNFFQLFSSPFDSFFSQMFQIIKSFPSRHGTSICFSFYSVIHNFRSLIDLRCKRALTVVKTHLRRRSNRQQSIG